MRIHVPDLALPVCVSSALAIGLLTGRATAGEGPCGSLTEIARFDASFIANFELFEDYLAVYLSEGLESNVVRLYDAHALPELVLRGTIEVPAASNGMVFPYSGPGSGWIEIDGDRLYYHSIAVEPGGRERLHGWDISDLSSPAYLGSIRSYPIDHNVYRGMYFATYLDDEPYAAIASFAEFPEPVFIAGMDTEIAGGSPFHFIDDYVLTAGSYYDPNIGGPVKGLFTSRFPDASLPPGMQTVERVAVLRSDDFDLPYGFAGFTAVDELAVIGNFNDEGVLVADISDPLTIKPIALLEDQKRLAIQASTRLIGIERGVAYLPAYFGAEDSQVIELAGPNAGRLLGDTGLPPGVPVRVRNRTLIQRVAPADGEPTGPSAVVLYDLGDCGLCPADLVTPWRTLDLADINAFVSGFVGTDPQSDLNDDGVWDLGDVQLFVASFNGGC